MIRGILWVNRCRPFSRHDDLGRRDRAIRTLGGSAKTAVVIAGTALRVKAHGLVDFNMDPALGKLILKFCVYMISSYYFLQMFTFFFRLWTWAYIFSLVLLSSWVEHLKV